MTMMTWVASDAVVDVAVAAAVVSNVPCVQPTPCQAAKAAAVVEQLMMKTCFREIPTDDEQIKHKPTEMVSNSDIFHN
jgi:hypothetical protein